MGDYHRKRLAVACDICRERRTRCDGRRPKCGFCRARGCDCVYRSAPEAPPTRLEQDISGIKERLDHLSDLFSQQFVRGDDGSLRRFSPHSPQSLPEVPLRDDAADNPGTADPDTSLGFPVMTIQRSVTMRLLGLREDTDGWLVNMERSHAPGSNIAGRPAGLLMLQPDQVTAALAAFSGKVHTWYPIFSDAGFTESFYKSINGLADSCTHTCLAMLVVAIGSLVQQAPHTAGLETRPDAQYFDRSVSFLAEVMADYSIAGLQCLVLFSLYHLCLLRPCHAHDYIMIASFRAQNMLKSRLYADDPHEMEALRRSCWAVHLIESELGIQLNFANSGIWKYDEHLQLPIANESWHFGTPAAATSPDTNTQSPQSHVTDRSDSAEVLTYFMAEIAMRRMLRRCTSSVSNWAGGRLQYAPIVADELERQLDQWYQYLPQPLLFHRQPTGAADVPELATAQFLQTQYSACKASIYWPAVYQAIESGRADQSQLLYCSKFFDAYVSFSIAIEASLGTCIPHAWTLRASVFIITLCAMRGASCPSLSSVINPKIFERFQCVQGCFKDVSQFSPSLSALGEILEERLKLISN